MKGDIMATEIGKLIEKIKRHEHLERDFGKEEKDVVINFTPSPIEGLLINRAFSFAPFMEKYVLAWDILRLWKSRDEKKEDFNQVFVSDERGRDSLVITDYTIEGVRGFFQYEVKPVRTLTVWHSSPSIVGFHDSAKELLEGDIIFEVRGRVDFVDHFDEIISNIFREEKKKRMELRLFSALPFIPEGEEECCFLCRSKYLV